MAGQLVDRPAMGANRSQAQIRPPAVEAGADMVLFGSTLTAADTDRLAPGPLASDVSGIVAAIVAAVQNAQLSQVRLDQAVLQVMRARGAELCPGS